MKKSPWQVVSRILRIEQNKINQRFEQLAFERMLRKELQTIPPLRSKT